MCDSLTPDSWHQSAVANYLQLGHIGASASPQSVIGWLILCPSIGVWWGVSATWKGWPGGGRNLFVLQGNDLTQLWYHAMWHGTLWWAMVWQAMVWQ